MPSDGTMPTASDLSRFQPRLAARAAGTPLNRFERNLARSMMQVGGRRRLPRTDPALKPK